MLVASSYVWSPSDHFGMWQLIVAVSGLSFGGWQLWLTRDAAQKTREAVDASTAAVSRRLMANDLLLLLPQLHRVEDEVESAATSGKRAKTSRSLMAYRRQANTISAQIRQAPEIDGAALLRALIAAAKASTDAKSLIEEGAAEPLAETVKNFRQKAAKVEAAAADLSAKLQRRTER